MSKNLDTAEILDNLSSIRFIEQPEDIFWEDYLENIAALAKSPVAILISNNGGEWHLLNEYKEKIFNEDIKELLIKNSTEISSRAVKNKYAYERFQNKKFTSHSLVSISQESMDKDQKLFVILLVDHSNKIEFSNIVLRAALCRDIFLSYKHSQAQKNSNIVQYVENEKQDINNEKYFEQALLLLNTILYENNFKLAAMTIVDELAIRFNCNRVSLGWQKDDYIYPVAINQVEHFTKSSALVKSLEAIFEESYEQDEEIFYPEDEDSSLITYAHKVYKSDNRLASLYTFPIRVNAKVVGVISFEKNNEELAYKDLEIIRLSLNYISPSLEKIYLNDRNILKKSIDKLKESVKLIVGPKNTLSKIFVLATTALMSWIIFGTMEYRVEAVAHLQTNNIAYISAPFDGIIEEVNIDIGDNVKKNDILIQFDMQELSLKKLEITSDIVRYSSEIEKARSRRLLADMKISSAKKEQAQTSLKKVNYFLNQAKIMAPFDSIVIEGSKEKLLGSPFSKGDIVLQLANPTELFARLKVLEQYIDEIKVGQIAELNLLSRPDKFFMVRIERIIPMANVDDVNGNIFIIKVLFIDKVEDWMRPGMSGIAKIIIEDRSIFWILTHKISDYLYMHIWW